jgi:hypothetical protein
MGTHEHGHIVTSIDFDFYTQWMSLSIMCTKQEYIETIIIIFIWWLGGFKPISQPMNSMVENGTK